ncbi:hypothetical protein WPG_1310 [Winogradskyella sp. PG-2]|nr:hypothetical protein WPG_1310 [Winogradskyella sp. PG-2]
MFLLFPFLGLSQIQFISDFKDRTKHDSSGHVLSLSEKGNIIAIGVPDNNGINQGNAHVRIYKQASGIWTQIGSDIRGKITEDVYGVSVSLSGDGNSVAVSFIGNDRNGKINGYISVYKNESEEWIQIGSDIKVNSVNQILNLSVNLSEKGDIIAIGLNQENGAEKNQSKVSVYKNRLGDWYQIGNDIVSQSKENKASNLPVSLAKNGNTIAIAFKASKVSVYENRSENWIQTRNNISIESIEETINEVCLSKDGSIIVIGVIAKENQKSYVSVYKNESGSWTQIGNAIKADSELYNSGYSVGISDDGNNIATGRYNLNNNKGDVSIYKNKSGNWIQIGVDIVNKSSQKFPGFGSSISLSGDGNSIAIGAISDNTNSPISGEVKIIDLTQMLLKEEQAQFNFNLYPNPAQNLFKIQLENNRVSENIRIYNNIGQLVLTSKETIINSSTLSTGLYVVEIETNLGKSSKKLIIE